MNKKNDREYDVLNMQELPRHIAVIMDGNGRWAKQRGLPRIMGHRAGVQSVKEIVRTCGELGINVLTLYAFSTENWNRPKQEVKSLMNILALTIKNELHDLIKNNVKLMTSGHIEMLPEKVKNILVQAMHRTKDNTGLILNLALNYGSRQEILDAVNCLLVHKKTSATEHEFASCLYTAGLPDPDLLIRTSSELRISNFLLWQIAYAELYFSPVLWPAFRKKNLIEALIEYQKRNRRFGGI